VAGNKEMQLMSAEMIEPGCDLEAAHCDVPTSVLKTKTSGVGRGEVKLSL
jgi:hypothetical protein